MCLNSLHQLLVSAGCCCRMAPEVIMQGRCTSKADIYSLGMLPSMTEQCLVSPSACVFISVSVFSRLECLFECHDQHL